MSTAPIGIFDSGLGGLTVTRAIRSRLPHEALLYFGDTARVPYGNKSPALVQELALDIARFLVARGAKTLVVACNTASALALESLSAALNIPVIGVIEPGVDAALARTQTNRIGVIGTLATIRSRAYQTLLKTKREAVHVVGQPCPLLVPLVEEGWLTDPVTRLVAEKYLAEMNVSNLDTLILGCTHYPLLKPLLRSVVDGKTALVDSAETVADRLALELKRRKLVTTTEEPGNLEIFVTDTPARFEAVARRFLGHPLKNVSLVHLP
ncbi:MAG: glutamate racemase [FCB group bacterium]|nr:glutamate racemase [FCB group bacterium]